MFKNLPTKQKIKNPLKVKQLVPFGVWIALLPISFLYLENKKTLPIPTSPLLSHADDRQMVWSFLPKHSHRSPKSEGSIEINEREISIIEKDQETDLNQKALGNQLAEYRKNRDILVKTPHQVLAHNKLLASEELQKVVEKTLLNTESSEQEKNVAIDYILELLVYNPLKAQALWSKFLQIPTSPEHPLWQWQLELVYRLLHHSSHPLNEEELLRYWNYAKKKQALAIMALPIEEL